MRYTIKHVLLFLGPLLIIVGLMYFMVGWTIYVSMNNWVGMAPMWKFIGLKNYATLLGLGGNNPLSDRFWVNFRNNIIWLFTFIIPAAVVGLLLAYGLELIGRAENLFRPIFLHPLALSFVVTGTLWAWMYDPGEGVINTVLRGVGLKFLAGPWIADPKIAVYCMVGAAIWQYTGFAMTLYIAGIRDIPHEIIEAAKVDGASTLGILYHIIIPNVMHSSMIAIAMLTLFSLKVFDLVWVMTMGGPGYETEVLSYYMFVATFRQQLVGIGAAISVIILLLSIAIIIPYSRWIMQRWME